MLDGEYPVRGYPNDLLLERVQIPSLSSRRVYFSVKFLYQIFANRIDSPSLLSKFRLNVPQFYCRKFRIFELFSARTNIMQFSPIQCMIKNYSSVDEQIDIFSTNAQELKCIISLQNLSLAVFYGF